MSGSGSLKLDTVGKYRYWVARYYDETHTQRKKRFPGTDAGKAAAKSFLEEIRLKKKAGVSTSTPPAVSSWIETYLTVYKANSLRESSLERMIQSYNKICLAPFAALPLDKVTAFEVQDFYNTLATDWTDQEGNVHVAIASSTIAKVHRLLAAAYKKALQQRLISYNPMDAVDPVKIHTKQMQVFTRGEIGKIFQSIRKIRQNKHNSKQVHDFRLFFRLLLETGMRCGEALALRWEDIDFTKAKEEITISRSKGKGREEFNEPKTQAGKRKIPILFEGLVNDLKRYRYRDNIIRVNGFVFEDKHGSCMDYHRVLDCWQHIQKLTGIEKTVHTFRHTAATWLLAQGEPVAEVSRILGHSSPNITYQIYVHATPGYNQRMIERFRKRAQEMNKPKNKPKRKFKRQSQC